VVQNWIVGIGHRRRGHCRTGRKLWASWAVAVGDGAWIRDTVERKRRRRKRERRRGQRKKKKRKEMDGEEKWSAHGWVWVGGWVLKVKD
jgi:hypothetical protein